LELHTNGLRGITGGHALRAHAIAHADGRAIAKQIVITIGVVLALKTGIAVFVAKRSCSDTGTGSSRTASRLTTLGAIAPISIIALLILEA
jgi:hypothetical protein